MGGSAAVRVRKAYLATRRPAKPIRRRFARAEPSQVEPLIRSSANPIRYAAHLA